MRAAETWRVARKWVIEKAADAYIYNLEIKEQFEVRADYEGMVKNYGEEIRLRTEAAKADHRAERILHATADIGGLSATYELCKEISFQILLVRAIINKQSAGKRTL